MSAPWVNISVEPCSLSFNRYDRPMYFTCNWCRVPAATKLVSRTSALTGSDYTDFACDRCAQEWEQKR